MAAIPTNDIYNFKFTVRKSPSQNRKQQHVALFLSQKHQNANVGQGARYKKNIQISIQNKFFFFQQMLLSLMWNDYE